MFKADPNYAAPCQATCPAGIDVPSYIALIAHGRYREAVELIRKDNPFPWVCGLICPHPCQNACVKGYQDAPLSIRALKGFVSAAIERLEKEHLHIPPARYLGKVAVIGSGPAGLSAAYYLNQMDYQVTVFEALPVAGGMMAVGIPEYRLPKDILKKEIDFIANHGVEIRLNTPIGGDLTIKKLREEGYQAIFVATGAHKPHQMRVDGEGKYSQVTSAIDFLRAQQIGFRERLGQNVVVVGGGNCAFDAARTSVRLGSKNIHIVYRRTLEEMPALREEIEQSREEGIQLHYLTIPVRIVGDGPYITGIECLKADLGTPDHTGRPRPIPVRGSEFTIPADGVIVAIGQEPDMNWLDPGLELDLTKWSSVVVNQYNLQTNIPYIFAGGDVVLGPATVVEAVAQGKKAALAMDRYIRGEKLPNRPAMPHARLQVETVKLEAKDKVAIPPDWPALLPVSERVRSFDQIEKEWDETRATTEAKRCLRCDLCIGCGECAKVCRVKMEVDALRFTDAGGDRVVIADMLRPQEKCIGCGSCVNICPTGCLKLVDEEGVRKLIKCGTTLAKLPMAQCKDCGEYFVPQRYLEYIERVAYTTGKKPERHPGLCPDCARKHRGDQILKRHHQMKEKGQKTKEKD